MQSLCLIDDSLYAIDIKMLFFLLVRFVGNATEQSVCTVAFHTGGRMKDGSKKHRADVRISGKSLMVPLQQAGVVSRSGLPIHMGVMKIDFFG